MIIQKLRNSLKDGRNKFLRNAALVAASASAILIVYVIVADNGDDVKKNDVTTYKVMNEYLTAEYTSKEEVGESVSSDTSATETISNTPAQTEETSSETGTTPVQTTSKQTTETKSTVQTTVSRETTTVSVEINTQPQNVFNMSDEAIISEGKRLYEMYRSYAEEVLKYTNEVRAQAGVAPLTLDGSLCIVSFGRAYEMIAGNKVNHERPNGLPWSSLTDSAGINYEKLGENIAAGNFDPQMVVNKWKNSERHYNNMINPEYTKLGVGYFHDDNFIYLNTWVQTFMK